MPDPDFDRLRGQLLDAGIAPRHARRTLVELKEHFADLREDLMNEGFCEREAEAEASRQLGPLDTIAAMISARPELRRWTYRYPQIGRLVLPIAYADTCSF